MEYDKSRRGFFRSHFDEGVLTMELPYWMGTQSVNELEALMEIVIRGFRRRAELVDAELSAQADQSACGE